MPFYMGDKAWENYKKVFKTPEIDSSPRPGTAEKEIRQGWYWSCNHSHPDDYSDGKGTLCYKVYIYMTRSFYKDLEKMEEVELLKKYKPHEPQGIR